MVRQLTEYVKNLASNVKGVSAVLLVSTLGLGAVWIANDYNTWVAFGTGGTPSTFRGYLRMTKFRILRALSSDDLKDPSQLSSEGLSYLDADLPERPGPRPRIVSRTMPHRQYPEKLDPAVSKRLHDLPRKYAEKHSDLLDFDKSNTEGRSTDAIYAKFQLPGRQKGAKDRILGHEIAHVHPADNSLHIWLTEPDAKKAIQAGWGERFPLSALGLVHNGWILVYAPRSMDDVDVIERILKAGISHLTGQQV